MTNKQNMNGTRIGNLRCLQWNMNHSAFAVDLLSQFLTEHHIDVLIIQDPPRNLCNGLRPFRDFQTFIASSCDDRSEDFPNGPLTAILVRTNIPARPIPLPHNRICAVLVSSSLGPLAFVSAYFHYADGSASSMFTPFLARIRSMTSLILIGADMNGHSRWWGPPDQVTNAAGMLAEDFVLDNHLIVQNRWPSPPTFASDRGFSSWIDATLSSPRLSPRISSWNVLDSVLLGSDHCPLVFDVSVSIRLTRISPRLNWKSVSWTDFRSSLDSLLKTSALSTMSLGDPSSLDNFASVLSDVFQHVIAAHVPVSHPCSYSNPWWTPELAALRSKLLRLRRKWKRTKSAGDKRAANDAKRELRLAVVEAKRRSWRRFCDDVSSSDMWKTFRKFMRRSRSPAPPALISEGRSVSDDPGKVDLFSHRFFPETLQADDDFHARLSENMASTLDPPSADVLPPVTHREFHEAVHRSDPWKAPGNDRVPFVVLRQCEDILEPFLMAFFNASLRLRYVPSLWKVANVVAVPKPNGDLSDPKGYRPISLLSCISKTLENIVTARLTHFLERQRCLSSTQFGFRKGRSTEWALWHLVSAATTALQNRQRLVLLSLDLQGAYDRVWHDGLLRKLHDMHVPLPLIGWIRSFLSGRVAHLRVGTATSTRSLPMGVPQGSPLSPILFLVYIDDLLRQVEHIPGAQPQGYADDTAVWWIRSRGESDRELSTQLARCLDDWAHRWKMTFSTSKCKIMAIGRIRDDPPSFRLNGTPVERVTCLRYLGVWLDSKLSWAPHIRQVTQKALTRLSVVQWGLRPTWGFHPMIARRMIDAAILPVLFYAAPVWCAAIRHPSVLAPVNRVLRRCAVTVMGLLRTTSAEAALATAGLHTADIYIRRKLVEFFLRHLSYGHDVSSPLLVTRRLNQTRTPTEILREEITSVCRDQQLPESIFARVERRRWWYSDPSDTAWEPNPSFLTREEALSRVRRERAHSPPDSLWIFCDGSVFGTSCGAAALSLRGLETHGSLVAVRFSGQHSSTHAELVALRIGCLSALEHTHIKCVTFVSDSMPALEGIRWRNGGSEVAVSTREALIALHHHIPTVRLWWMPAHVDLAEHDRVDSAAKRAAEGLDSSRTVSVPLSHMSLKTLIRRHFDRREHVRWAVHSHARHLLPRYDPSLSWTKSLSRKAVALTAQFLTGHFVTANYLHRFHLRDSPSCVWCGHPVCDRKHVLFDCPRFEYHRQQLCSDACLTSSDSSALSWDLLSVSNRSHLARFLLVVDRARRSVRE